MSSLDEILRQLADNDLTHKQLEHGNTQNLDNAKAQIKAWALELVNEADKAAFRVEGRINGNSLQSEGFGQAIRAVKAKLEES